MGLTLKSVDCEQRGSPSIMWASLSAQLMTLKERDWGPLRKEAVCLHAALGLHLPHTSTLPWVSSFQTCSSHKSVNQFLCLSPNTPPQKKSIKGRSRGGQCRTGLSGTLWDKKLTFMVSARACLTYLASILQINEGPRATIRHRSVPSPLCSATPPHFFGWINRKFNPTIGWIFAGDKEVSNP